MKCSIFEPMIITQTPLRISLLGGGTDFPDFYLKYGGAVLTTAIDKYVYCIVKERFDNLIYISYTVKEVVENVRDLKHELVREALIKTGVNKGLEIAFLSDIPATGTGLGSSSSVTVGVLNTLYQYQGKAIEASRLASEACEIEIETLEKPIGAQDQTIAAYGGIKFIEFKKDGRVQVEPVSTNDQTIDDLQKHIMVFFTGKTRKSESVLTEQKNNISNKIPVLQEMAAQAKEGKKLLEQGKIYELGKLLDKGWELKRSLANGVSDSEIDELYKQVKKAGAIGGKISGAGGGGFMTLLVPTNRRDSVRKAIKGLREMPVGFSVDGSKVIFNIRK